MLRQLLLLVLIALVARAVWRVIDGVIEGVRGGRSLDSRSTGGASQAVQMARDPVCGTFVLPGRAVTLADPGGTLYFCSPQCRDAYRPDRRAGRPDSARGRTA